MTDQDYHVKTSEIVAYSLGDTGTNLAWRSLLVFLPIFYTDVFGLTAASVGTLLLVCRLGDGITDITMGSLADRTVNKMGKYRPWILYTSFPLGIAMILLFTTPDLSYSGKLGYAYVTYILVILLYTANNIPYSALLGVITPNPKERTTISSYRFLFAYLGALLVQGFALDMVDFLGNGDEATGYTATMGIFAVVLIILLVISAIFTKERVQPKVPKSSVRSDLKDLLKNRPWIFIFCMGLLFVTFIAIKTSLILYYFTHFLKEKEMAAIFMIIGLVASMIGAASLPFLSKRFDNKSLFIIGMSLSSIFTGLLYLQDKGDMGGIFILGTLSELTAGMLPAIIFAMLGDAADFSEWKNRRSAVGLIFSSGTLSFKFGGGLAGALTGWYLAWYGYTGGGIPSALSLEGIRNLFSIIPAVIGLLAVIVALFYPLGRQKMEKVASELATLRQDENQ